MRRTVILFTLIFMFIPIVSSAHIVQEAWVARYNGTGNSDDKANAITVDANGNVYVTGESKGSAGNLDYTTIKYGPSGNQLWVARYNGPGNGDDRATAIAVDANGNVYVTGESKGNGGSADYATIKYDTNGNMLWVGRYDGPAGSDDIAHGIALDGNGNVVVTGESKGNSTGFDYATIKYSANGSQIWVKRYNGPVSYQDSAYAVAVDLNGNIYVTGESKGNQTCLDFATIKYDINGNQLWVKRSNNPSNSHDAAYALSVDNSGNVYVTGKSKSSTYHYDYMTIKYDTNGNEKWLKRYNGSGNGDDSAYAIAVDGVGNVYLTGESEGNGTDKDYVTIKYDTNGNVIWIARYDGPRSEDDSAYAIAVDGSGNVYVTGASDNSSYFFHYYRDYATIKYDANGNALWVATYNGPANRDDSANAIAVDPNGYVYVTGRSEGNSTNIDYLTIKYGELKANFTGTPTSGYQPLVVQFTDRSTGNITNWSWNFGDGGTSTEQNPSHTYTSGGTFTVTLTVTGPSGSATETKTNYIHVSGEVPPVANFTAVPTSGNLPLTVNFTDGSTGGITSWSWNFGDGGTSTLKNPSHTYTSPGNFTVTLTVTGAGGTDTMQKANYIHVSETPPDANFSGIPTSGYRPLTVHFTDSSTGNIASRSWSFGDGGTSTEQNPSHTFMTAGTFTVSLTVTGPGGSDTETKSGYIVVTEAPPIANFSGTPTNGYKPLTVQFTDGSTGTVTSWSWNFGDGGTSTEQNPSHAYTSTGTFTVSLTVTGPGGSDTKKRTGYIVVTEAPPDANFSGTPANGYVPLTVHFTDSSTGVVTSWLWSFGDGGTSTAQNPTYTYFSTGTHTVTLTVSGPGGNDTETKTGYINVSESTKANFSGTPTSGYKPLTVQFTDSSTGAITSWSWSFGDGGTSTAQNPSHTYTSTGTYTVSLTVTGPSGTDTATRTNYIQVSEAPPIAHFSGTPTTGYRPLTVQFTDSSTGNITSRSWSFGDGGTSTAQNPSHTFMTAGTFTVSLTVTGPGGSDTETKTGYVAVTEAPPLSNFSGAPTSGYRLLTVQFADGSSGVITSWLWNFGDGGTSTEQNPSHTYTSSGTYTVSLKVTGPGGADTETKTNYIRVTEAPPEANFSGTPTSGYKPLTVQFTDSSTGSITSRSWTFGDGGTSTAQNPVHTFNSAGTFTVSLTVTGPGGSDTETKINYIHVSEAPPLAKFSANKTSGYKPLTVQFSDESTGNITGWSWSFGDGGTSTAQNPTHTYSSTGCFDVSLTVTGQGGSDSLTRVDYICVNEAPPIANFSANIAVGNKPLTVLFSDQSTGNIENWAWDFGDGATSTLQNPSHTYTSTGDFTVTLTVTGPGGSDSEIKTAYITVRECNVKVPEDYPTIQSAIDASANGCNILVTSGVYTENINFLGKSLKIKAVGTSGFCNCSNDLESKVTIIGKYNESVVTFNNGETRNAVLEGFTIKNGFAPLGGGIHIENASPTIKDCYIYENNGYEEGGTGHGGGIAVIGSSASPLFFNDLIFRNAAQDIEGGSHGGGIYVSNGASPTIQNCTIADNFSNSPGGGIYITSDSSPRIIDSIIWHNNPEDLVCEAGCGMDVTYSDVGETIPGIGNISKDPLFVSGSLSSYLGNYYISHVRAGQDSDSPCIDTGSTLARNSGLDIRNTANDGIPDRSEVDMGYHYTPTPIYIQDAITSPGTIFSRGQNIRYSITYRIEGNPETLYKVIGKITVKGSYKYTVSKIEKHYPGVYVMNIDSTVPYTAVPGKATITYKVTLKQAGKTYNLGIDTRTSQITVK